MKFFKEHAVVCLEYLVPFLHHFSHAFMNFISHIKNYMYTFQFSVQQYLIQSGARYNINSASS